MNKYNAEKVNRGDRSFASKAEAALFDEFALRERAGEVKVIQCQDHIKMTDADIVYIADFKLQDLKTGEIFWAEMKGFETDIWRIKRRLYLKYGPGKLEIYKPKCGRITLVETLIPKPSDLCKNGHRCAACDASSKQS